MTFPTQKDRTTLQNVTVRGWERGRNPNNLEGNSLNNKFRISNNQLKDQYVENLTIKTYYTVSSV